MSTATSEPDTRGRQWGVLAALTFLHVTVDMYGGILPAILPVVRREFGLTLTAGVTLISILNLVCNGMQIATGHLRATKTRPLFIPLGMVMTMVLVLIAFLPHSVSMFPVLVVLAVVTATGIAILHPEALRALHALRRLPHSLGTAVFLNGGYAGYAGGALVASLLVSAWGLFGLVGFWVFSVAGLVMLGFVRIRLALETDEEGESAPAKGQAISFPQLMMLAIPVTIGSTLVPVFLPTRLNELGFELAFGGISSMVFGMGGALGALGWAWLAHRRGILPTVLISLSAGIVLLTAYTFCITARPSVWILAGAGFCLNAVFPLIVTLARSSRGPGLGARMGLIVGGTWGVASLTAMAMGPVAERFGTQTALYAALVAYACGVGVGGWLMREGWRKG
ncbi:MAG: MFS transporter [Lentisphaerae bacterium]|nr:MFS transporter [Lentisphaerota bacterium]